MKTRLISRSISSDFYGDFQTTFSLPIEPLTDILAILSETEKDPQNSSLSRTLSDNFLEKYDNIPVETLSGAISVLNYFRHRQIEEQLSVNDTIEEIQELANKKIKDKPLTKEQIQLISKYLAYNHDDTVRIFKDDYFGEIIPRLESVTGNMNLRVIRNKKKKEMIDLIPVGQIKMNLDTDKKDNTFSFEVDEDGLKKLVEVLNDFSQQLSALKLLKTQMKK